MYQGTLSRNSEAAILEPGDQAGHSKTVLQGTLACGEDRGSMSRWQRKNQVNKLTGRLADLR